MKTPAGVRCTGGSWPIADAGFIRDALIDKMQPVEIGLPFQPLSSSVGVAATKTPHTKI
jgi:hypothetical protein